MGRINLAERSISRPALGPGFLPNFCNAGFVVCLYNTHIPLHCLHVHYTSYSTRNSSFAFFDTSCLLTCPSHLVIVGFVFVLAPLFGWG